MDEESIDIEVSICKEDKTIYISEECSSGCYYSFNNKSDIIKAFKDYVKMYLTI